MHDKAETAYRTLSFSFFVFRLCFVDDSLDTVNCRCSLERMHIPQIFAAGSRRKWPRFLGESLGGSWVIALLGFSGYVLHFNPESVGFLFLLVVVSEAILFGFWQATIVSLLACGCLDYF